MKVLELFVRSVIVRTLLCVRSHLFAHFVCVHSLFSTDQFRCVSDAFLTRLLL